MSLTDKKSMYDRHELGNIDDGTVGRDHGDGPNPKNGKYYRSNGFQVSPFSTSKSGDHLIDLLKDREVKSPNSGLSYNPELMRGGNRPFNITDTSGDQDFDGNDNGQGIFTIGHLQGKTVEGVDLHKHLLTKDYHYKHGDSQTSVHASPANVGDYQDFIDNLDPLTEYPGSNPSLGQFGGPYKNTGPADGFY